MTSVSVSSKDMGFEWRVTDTGDPLTWNTIVKGWQPTEKAARQEAHTVAEGPL